ncbi:MAG TPA: hypothetical protein VGO48_04070 [Conexibacter sp.]|nr:hypothetical protein [Conexibacter sp.]
MVAVAPPPELPWTSVPAGASALRKELRAIELAVTMVLLIVILWITRR